MNFVRMSDGVVGLLVLFSVATYAVAVEPMEKWLQLELIQRPRR
jgi:hypothetical protein